MTNKKQRINKDIIIYSIVILVIILSIFISIYIPYSFYDKNYKLVQNTISQKRELQSKIINSEIEDCEKFYLLSLTSSTYEESNYWVNKQTNCLLLRMNNIK